MKVDKLLNVNNMDRKTLLSCLYFTGGLTYGNKTEKEVELKIPNNTAKDNYIQEIQSFYELSDEKNAILEKAVQEMFQDSLERFVNFIGSEFLSVLKGNDVELSDESSLKTLFIFAIICTLGTKSISFPDISEHTVKYKNFEVNNKLKNKKKSDESTSVDLFLESGDLPSIVHIEFKNTKINQIKGCGPQKSWEEKIEISEHLYELEKKKLFDLELFHQDFCVYLEKKMLTINDKWQSVIAQAKDNHDELVPDLNGRPLISYVVYRIGLKRVLWQKIN